MASDPLRLLRTEDTREKLLPLLREQGELEITDLVNKRRQKDSLGYGDTDETQEGILPTQSQVTQRFGNYNPALYRGINESMTNTGVDFAASVGTPAALPSGNWVIQEAATGNGFNKGYGNSVLAINEDTGEMLRFSHLSKVNVIPGRRLRGGSVIGYTGATGNVTGPHLDLEFYDKSGKVQDVLQSRYARELFKRG